MREEEKSLEEERLFEHVRVAKADAANAWRAKEELGKELKAAFMRGVCQLNLETASIMGALGLLCARPTDEI